MRKIEYAMIAAIRAGKNWRLENTEVRQDEDACRVLLHENVIAEFPTAGTPRWTLAGWNTPTTRSRIKALVSAFGGPSVSSRNLCPVIPWKGGFLPIYSWDWVSFFDPSTGHFNPETCIMTRNGGYRFKEDS